MEGNSSPNIHASGSLPRLAIAHLPPGEGSNSLPVTVHPSLEGNSAPSIQASGSLPSPAIAHLPPREGSNSLPATVHPSLEGNSAPSIQASGSLPSPAIAHLPPREGSNSLPATVHPSLEGNSAPTFQAPGPATAHLPAGEGSSSLPGASHLPLEDVSSSQASSLHIHSEGNSSPHPSSTTQAGQGHNPPRADRQGNRHPSRHSPTQSSQEVNSTSQEGNPTPIPPGRSNQGSSSEEPNPKWVINLSNKPLTPAQRSVLAKGPNFVVTPRQPPNLEYITAIGAACTKLSQQDTEELRANISRVLRSCHPPKPNLTKAQNAALRELKGDRDHIVLTADKGVAMVVMDKQDYINKANQSLNQNTYKVISKDPTNTIKNKLINILKGIKTKSGLGINTFKVHVSHRLCPT